MNTSTMPVMAPEHTIDVVENSDPLYFEALGGQFQICRNSDIGDGIALAVGRISFRTALLLQAESGLEIRPIA